MLLVLAVSALCTAISAQPEFKCDAKMTEMAEWRPVSATIVLTGNIISVNEVIGIELKIEVDKWQDLGNTRFYSLKYNGVDNVRMGHPINPDANNIFVVSVLKDHYRCIKKENQ